MNINLRAVARTGIGTGATAALLLASASMASAAVPPQAIGFAIPAAAPQRHPFDPAAQNGPAGTYAAAAAPGRRPFAPGRHPFLPARKLDPASGSTAATTWAGRAAHPAWFCGPGIPPRFC